jgi:hypothetical protein
MAKVLGRSIFFAALLACSWPARAADPMLMFLFSVAKEVALSLKPTPTDLAREKSADTGPEMYPGTTVEVALLRRLIQDSFLYLSEAQRDEIFEALHVELMKPENFAIRAPAIDYFSQRALQVRAAQIKLSQLSSSQKQVMAQEFRKEARGMPEEDVAQLREILERGLLPVPSDLGQLFLSALN